MPGFRVGEWRRGRPWFALAGNARLCFAAFTGTVGIVMSGVLAGRVRDVGPKHLWFWLGQDFILVPLELEVSTIRVGSRVAIVYEEHRDLRWVVRVTLHLLPGALRPDRRVPRSSRRTTAFALRRTSVARIA